MYPTEPPFQRIQFYLTAHYACSYLPEQRARSQVATPAHLIDGQAYSALIRAGFRRSGQFTYRPHCETCNACVPVRVDVARFVPSRTQRRCLARNRHLAARFLPLDFKEEHYALYRSYLGSRHAGGGMDRDSPDQYTQFLLSSNVDTVMVEFRDGDNGLAMISVVESICMVHYLAGLPAEPLVRAARPMRCPGMPPSRAAQGFSPDLPPPVFRPLFKGIPAGA